MDMVVSVFIRFISPIVKSITITENTDNITHVHLWSALHLERPTNKCSMSSCKLLYSLLQWELYVYLGMFWLSSSKTLNNQLTLFIIGLAITDLFLSCIAFVGVAESVLNIKLHLRILLLRLLVCRSVYFLVSIIAFDRCARRLKRKNTVSSVKQISVVALLTMMMISMRSFSDIGFSYNENDAVWWNRPTKKLG